jgi:hypothetical protein
MARLDTTLESEGAEFLVLGNMLIQRIPTYKTYTNMPGYDLVATNPEKNTSARIQVKSRWETGSSGFPIKNYECDFVVAAFLNRGSKTGKKKVKDPIFYVLPIEVIVDSPRSETWNKFYLRYLTDPDIYRDNWTLISTFLDGEQNNSDHSMSRGSRLST